MHLRQGFADDDGVNLGFPGARVVGIKARGEAYGKFRTDYADFQVLKYAPISSADSRGKAFGRL
jgi:hypothetical protein